MISNYSLNNIPELVKIQLSNFFPISLKEYELVEIASKFALNRTDKCIGEVDNKYFHVDGNNYFNPFHSGQWLIYLYYLSNAISLNKFDKNVNYDVKIRKELADKLYYLNKIMHSVDIYHEVELPTSFFLEHPVGTVLGRAQYGNGFMAYQNCTVGGNKGKYPILGNNFRMMSGSKILGNSIVGENVTLAANTYVKDTNLPDGVTVFGQSPNLIYKYL